MTDELREEIQEIAWRDFISFAWSDPKAHAAYRGFAGLPQRPQRSDLAINQLIDRACGVNEISDEYVEGFVLWVTEHHWGTEYAPKKMREKFMASRPVPSPDSGGGNA